MATAKRDDGLNTYSWEGKDRRGKIVRGQVRAASPTVVRATLRRQGIQVEKVGKLSSRSRGKVSDKDVTLFTRQMATMMKSGVPLLQAFDIVGKGAANPAMGKLVMDIKAEVETGAALNQAFRKYPLHFDNLYCNLIEAGEQAGILDQLMERLATYKEKTQAIIAKIKSALFYPIAVLVVAFIVTAVIMIFVVPRFKEVFTSFGADLPGPTLMVMAISDFFVANWFFIFGIIGISLYSFFYMWKRSEKMQIVMDRLMLRLPIFGEVIRKATLARWTRTLSTMFAAGVPLVEALDSVGGASGNYIYKQATRQIKADVSTGSSLTIAMQNTQVFPNMALQMLAIGEESGQIDAMSGKVADFYEAEVDDAVSRLSSLMEPLIMVVLGVLIGGIIVAMYLPIFKLGGVV